MLVAGSWNSSRAMRQSHLRSLSLDHRLFVRAIVLYIYVTYNWYIDIAMTTYSTECAIVNNC